MLILMSYLLQTCSTMLDLIKVCFLSLPFLIWCSFNIIICDMNRKYWSYTKLDVNRALMKMAGWYFTLNQTVHSNPRWRASAHVFKKTLPATLRGSVQIKSDSVSIMLLRTHHTGLQHLLQCFCWDFVKGWGINFLVCYLQYDNE